MKHVDVYLAELDNPAIAQIYYGHYIDIDLHQCKIEACYQKRDFIETVARVINHEFLHYAILETTDEDTSSQFDAIAKDLKDYWGW